MNIQNLITSTDSYKVSHWQQFPVNMTSTSYYIESRSEGVMLKAAGFNYLAKLLSQKITREQVEEANEMMRLHFGRDLFNYAEWMMIANLGYFPVRMVAVPEGTVIPSKHTMCVLEPTCERFSWLPGWLETTALRAVWYATSVATKSWECKKVLEKYLTQTSDLTGSEYDFVLSTRLHDFGARGSSSSESASIAGLAHLYNFQGTDTIEALVLAKTLFGVDCAGISIPAREHSTTIVYKNEDDAYLNSIEQYGTGAYACVMDSSDYKLAVLRVCKQYAEKIKEMGGCFVFRPDSGYMVDNIMYTLDLLAKYFGYTVNSKGFKVLSPHCRIIQGDGIEKPEDIEKVLAMMTRNGYSTENIAFGMGGGLHQRINRDTYKFAMKLSYIEEMDFDTGDVSGRGVSKCPKGSEWKASKSGKRRLVKIGGEFHDIDVNKGHVGELWMKTYYEDGVVYPDTLEQIRSR